MYTHGRNECIFLIIRGGVYFIIPKLSFLINLEDCQFPQPYMHMLKFK